MALPDNETYAAIAAMLDHALLRPEMTEAEVRAGCESARAYECASVCVRPSDVPLAASILAGASKTVVCTVIGFPHGTTSTAAKVAESKEALAHGCKELDMVLNIGWLRSGKLDAVRDDIAAVVAAGHAGGAIVKVILETAYLNDEQKSAACRAATEAGADFVKTSTGFASAGSNAHDLRLMRAAVPASMRVKASGGVKSLDAVVEARALGCARCGTSSTFAILDDVKARIAAPGGFDLAAAMAAAVGGASAIATGY